MKLLFVGPGEGCVIAKTAAGGCFQYGTALLNQCSGEEKTLLKNITVQSIASLCLEFSHKMVFTQVIFSR